MTMKLKSNILEQIHKLCDKFGSQNNQYEKTNAFLFPIRDAFDH